MKRIFLTVFAVTAFFFMNGCRDNMVNIDRTPPAVPQGVQTSNGDGDVLISWEPNRDRDLEGYNVYTSDSYNGKYTLLTSTTATSYLDNGVRNGHKYYYAVTAYDYNGNESELSYENAYGVPRPQGLNQSIFDYHRYARSSGFVFSTNSVVADTLADFIFDIDAGTSVPYLDVWNDTDIKDMGPTNEIYDITTAPSSGWATSKDAVAVVGHTYVIWTLDNHFAKVRVKSITSDRIVFDWAYQTITGEPMMKRSGTGTTTRTLSSEINNRVQK